MGFPNGDDDDDDGDFCFATAAEARDNTAKVEMRKILATICTDPS